MTETLPCMFVVNLTEKTAFNKAEWRERIHVTNPQNFGIKPLWL